MTRPVPALPGPAIALLPTHHLDPGPPIVFADPDHSPPPPAPPCPLPVRGAHHLFLLSPCPRPLLTPLMNSSSHVVIPVLTLMALGRDAVPVRNPARPPARGSAYANASWPAVPAHPASPAIWSPAAAASRLNGLPNVLGPTVSVPRLRLSVIRILPLPAQPSCPLPPPPLRLLSLSPTHHFTTFSGPRPRRPTNSLRSSAPSIFQPDTYVNPLLWRSTPALLS